MWSVLATSRELASVEPCWGQGIPHSVWSQFFYILPPPFEVRHIALINSLHMNTRSNFRIRLLLTGCHSHESDAPPHLEDLDLPDPACDSNLFAHIQSIPSMHARDRLDQVFLAELKASEPNSPKNYIKQPTAQRCPLGKKKVDGNFKHVPTNSEIRDSLPTLALLERYS